MSAKPKSCCFIGHSKIEVTKELTKKLYSKIEYLINEQNVGIFLFGSKSQFNDLCYLVVTELKNKYTYIERVYVRAEYEYIDESYKNYLLDSYEKTYYPEKVKNAGRLSYIKRNFEMIDKSEFCIFYYIDIHKNKSGTKTAFEYAVKKSYKNIINILFD